MDERNVEEELKTGAAVNDGEHQEESHSPAPNENEHYQGSSAVTTALTTDTAGTSEGPLITLDEFIEDQIKLEAEAEALLGGSDDMVCTYPEGYKPRQPLYACLDCVTGQSDFAGVCYGCSLHCHGNHNLIELYTKRNFCCDCGNSKFPSPCTLFKQKKAVNERNLYNHNFKGLYCECNKPYPDEEYVGKEEMLQCCVCEDWFHLEHIVDGEVNVDLENIGELICRKCVERLPFVLAYSDENYLNYKKSDESSQCLYVDISENVANSPQTIFFKTSDWRKRLCRCKHCMDMYEDLKIVFLTDLDDSTTAYENSHRNTEPLLDDDQRLMDALVKVAGRDGAITIRQGYEKMKQKLVRYLKRVAEEKSEITKDDIGQFFASLESDSKRRKL